MKYHACLLAFLFLLPALGFGASKIYQTKDANGNVIFTDVPPAKEGEAEEPIVLKETNTWQTDSSGSASSTGRTPWIVDDEAEGTESVFVPYSTIAISEPANDTAIRDNIGFVSVTFELSPPLSSDHRLRLLMDGKPIGESSGTSFQIENVDRGTHSLLVEVVNDDGTSLQQSATTTFHMLRYHQPVAKPKKKGK